jgi:hypothetical protein
MLFGAMNPKTIFKVLRAAGVRIHFDLSRQSLILRTDDSEKAYTFAEIEQLVNGVEHDKRNKTRQDTDLAGRDSYVAAPGGGG